MGLALECLGDLAGKKAVELKQQNKSHQANLMIGKEIPQAPKEKVDEAAEGTLKKGMMQIHNVKKAIRCFTSCLESGGMNDTMNIDCYCKRADCYVRLNEFQNAINDCEKALQIDPLCATAYGVKGLAYTCLDQWDLAVEAYEKALEIEPENKDYRDNLKTAKELPEVSMGNVDEAASGTLMKGMMRISNLKEAINIYTTCFEVGGIDDTTSIDFYCKRAECYASLNEFQNAINDCEKALQIDPLCATAYGVMGLAYTGLDQWDLAVKACEKAVEIEPKNKDYQDSLKIAKEMPEVTMGKVDEAALKKGISNLKEAIKCFTSCLESGRMDDTMNIDCYCKRADCYVRLNEFQNAINDCEKALQIDPLCATAYNVMGLAYTRLHQIDLAVKACEKAVEIEPENKDYQHNLKVAKRTA